MTRFALLALILAAAAAPASAGLVGTSPVPRNPHQAFVIGYHSDFDREQIQLRFGLAMRGYRVSSYFATQAPGIARAQVLQALQDAAADSRRGDKFVISLECHGANSAGAIPDPSAWQRHVCCLDDDCHQYLMPQDLLAVSRTLVAHGAQVAVMDNSCTGGATVQGFESQLPQVCAMSSTSAVGPSLTGFPHYGQALLNTSIQNLEQLSEWGETEILREHPDRIFQRAFRSGCASSAMLLRDHYQLTGLSLGNWNLQGTPMYRTLHPELAQPPAITRSNEDAFAYSCAVADRFRAQWDGMASELYRVSGEIAVQDSFRANYSVLAGAYAGAGLAFPANVHSLADLDAQIVAGVQRIRDLRDQLDLELHLLNDTAATHMAPAGDLDGGLDAGLEERETRIAALRADTLSLMQQVIAQNSQMSALLNVYEEIVCRSRPSPCRDFTI